MVTTTKFKTKFSDAQLQEALAGIFTAHGFSLKQYKGDMVWKKGSGWLTAPQFFKVTKEDELICIDSWMPFALFPGVYIGKSGLDNSFGYAVKIPMRKLLKEIVNISIAPDTQPQGYMPK